MRAFIALELPADFADDTAAAARRLSASLEGRFLDRSTYHLTLAFLGDIDDAEASRAMDALDVACAGSAPVSLAPDGLGKFGRPADATLWLGVAPDPALQALAEAFPPSHHLGAPGAHSEKAPTTTGLPAAGARPHRHTVQEHAFPRRRRIQAALHSGAGGAGRDADVNP